MAIGGIIVISILCRKKRRRQARSGPGRTVTTRTTKTVYTLGTNKPIDAEKLRQQQQRDAARREKERFTRMQAVADLDHYKQVKTDLLKAYNAALCDGDSEKAIRKRIQYDNAIRRTEKQIEKAAYNARRTG